MGECSSVINTLIERGVAVRDNRKWEEPSSLSVNLGSGDCLDVMVPTAENPWDFHVHLVRDTLYFVRCVSVSVKVARGNIILEWWI